MSAEPPMSAPIAAGTNTTTTPNGSVTLSLTARDSSAQRTIRERRTTNEYRRGPSTSLSVAVAIAAAATIADLVCELGLAPEKVAVERNGEIAPRSRL